MSAQNPVKITARQGRGENIVQPLFVYEYRCMAAPAEGRATPIASLNRETKPVRRGNDPACLIPQNRSGFSSPKVPLPRPGRRLRFCVADWISAVPLAMTAALLLASPKSAIKLARGAFGAHLLDLKSIRVIEGEGFGQA
jgi:hypothetical protein